MILEIISVIFFVLGVVGLSFAISVPINGVLVRFRVNYSPKRLQLDTESGMEPPAGPVVKSYFGMFKRVYRLEGISGLYKGLWPTIASTFVLTMTIMPFMDVRRFRSGSYRAPDVGILATAFYVTVLAFVSIPSIIITNRSIATPHKLPSFNVAKGLRMLLSPAERRHPWLLYATPGLVVAQLLHISIVMLGLNPLRRFLLPELSFIEGGARMVTVPLGRLSIYLATAACSTVLLTPLEVIVTRLAIQRNLNVADNSTAENPEYSGAAEDVIELRDEEDPYLGLLDCVKRIANEEGWTVLYRAWWITLLGSLASVFA